MNPADLQQLARILGGMALVSRSRSPGLMPGQRVGRTKGQGVELVDFRRYDRGDDVRQIDWNFFARSKKLCVREFQATAELTVHLLVDSSSSMSIGGDKLECAKTIAAGLAFVGAAQLDRIGIASFSDRIELRVPPRRGRGNLLRVLGVLEQLDACGPTDLRRAVEQYGTQSRGEGLIIIVSDFLSEGGYRHALEFLLHKRFEVVVVQLLSEQDLEPKIQDRVVLEDAEDRGLDRRIVDGTFLPAYRRRLTAEIQALADFCKSRQICHLQTTSSASLGELLPKFVEAGIWARA